MKKIYFFTLFFTSLTFSQTAKDFLINDNDKIFQSLTDVLIESKNYGYNFVRNDKGEYVFEDKISKYILIKKDIHEFRLEGFPENSVGSIWKKYRFEEIKNSENKKIWGIETEVVIYKWKYLSVNQIKKYYDLLKSEISNTISKNNFKISETNTKLNYKSITGKYYDFVEINIIKKPIPIKDSKEEYFTQNIYTTGEFFETKTEDYPYLFTFSFKNKDLSNFMDKMIELENSFTNLNNSVSELNKTTRFTIENQDMRNINQYDLEAMVKFFILDCKKNKIGTPELKTLNATFETLEGSNIALSYGFGDDNLIKIKVDPEKWAKSSTEKRWYVLYHELGHDILNLEHGQGGKMMFNFADKEYNWDDFFQDKEYMMNFLNSK